MLVVATVPRPFPPGRSPAPSRPSPRLGFPVPRRRPVVAASPRRCRIPSRCRIRSPFPCPVTVGCAT
ncbi:hypothetical protein DAT35_41150 [Vitiosangium sp. GDMCC 1.1324]|nr:hypothetical protein DAT35_41150 [Vitiosangium sp. GDMCC 1.1324]